MLGGGKPLLECIVCDTCGFVFSKVNDIAYEAHCIYKHEGEKQYKHTYKKKPEEIPRSICFPILLEFSVERFLEIEHFDTIMAF